MNDENQNADQPEVQETTVVTERTETPAPAENDPNAPEAEVGLDTAETVEKAEQIAVEQRQTTEGSSDSSDS